MPGLAEDAYLLPTDLFFKKDLGAAGFRLPAQTSSGKIFYDTALNTPSVIDGFSPRSPFFLPAPCNLREDIIPDGSSDSLFLYDLAFRRRIPITIRYRNSSNCGLIIQQRKPLEMDRSYALVVLSSYVWSDRIRQPGGLGRLFDRIRQEREDTPELEEAAARYGLRPRELRLTLDLLRSEGIPSSRILRIGIAAIRSRGGLLGPFFAIQKRHQLEDRASLQSVKRIGPGLYRLRVEVRNPCAANPCRIEAVYGPGMLALAGENRGSLTERDVLIRLPESEKTKAILWIEAPETTAQKNAELLQMTIFGRLTDEAPVLLAMLVRPTTGDASDRLAAILEKTAISELLQSFPVLELQRCAQIERCAQRGPDRNHDERPLIQLCLTDRDCAASAALDPLVGAVVLPTADETDLLRAPYEDGRLPDRNRILARFARDLREDLFSIDLNRHLMKKEKYALIHKKMHVTENIFADSQFDRLILFLRDTMDEKKIVK